MKNDENIGKLNIPNILTPSAVHKHLANTGLRVSKNKIYNLFKRKDFPSFKLGDRYYVSEDKLIEWLDKQSKKLKYIK